uniref:Presenilin n=1 Tax=Rhabditophanes sp. KR3021 TaxID=114890 RepID=A0AC35TQ69_9BILA
MSDEYSRKLKIQVVSNIYSKAFQPSLTMFPPVIANIVLTLAIWIGIYGMQQEKENTFYMNMLTSEGELSSGFTVVDGAVNAVFLLISIGLVSFGLLLLAVYECKKIIQAWLGFSLMSVIFGVFSIVAKDGLEAYDVPNAEYFTVGLGLIYGGIGSVVFFTDRLNLGLHQFYTVINCALVSVLYLRTFPEKTIWFILPSIIIWDIFAVWSPFGPLKQVTERAGGYNKSVLKFMMFTANDKNVLSKSTNATQIETTECLNQPLRSSVSVISEVDLSENDSAEASYEDQIVNTKDNAEDTLAWQKFVDVEIENNIDDVGKDQECDEEYYDSDGYWRYILSTQEHANKKKIIETAEDALNDTDAVRLGLGDFIFYSLLVGKSAVSISILSTIIVIGAVLIGLLITLVFLQKGDTVVPALPVSISLGLIFHFMTFYFIEPFLKEVSL